MTRDEQRRALVLQRVERREIGGAAAAELLGLSLRQVRRLLAAYREEGVAALAHGNRGRRPPHAVAQETKDRVLRLAQGAYAGCNDHHLRDLLDEREGIALSCSTVRRLLRAAALRSPRKRRPPKHRSRRARYPQEGMLLQVDGSKHQWLGEEGPWLTLVGAIDDATGTVPAALFRAQEDAQGYFLLLGAVLRSKGIPLALYSDRHGIFQPSPLQKETVEEQLAGRRRPTQVGQALEDLGIGLVLAHSPQAKGRVERLWGTFQSRLVQELRLAGATTIAEADRVLADFLPRFNQQFGVPPAQEGSAYRPLPPDMDLDAILCFKYYRTVAADNTVRLGEKVLQVLPTRARPSYAQARVEVQERLDGSVVVCYRGEVIATQDAPPSPVTLRSGKMRRQPEIVQRGRDPDGIGVPPPLRTAPGPAPHAHPPAPDHPWKKSMVTKSQNH